MTEIKVKAVKLSKSGYGIGEKTQLFLFFCRDWTNSIPRLLPVFCVDLSTKKGFYLAVSDVSKRFVHPENVQRAENYGSRLNANVSPKDRAEAILYFLKLYGKRMVIGKANHFGYTQVPLRVKSRVTKNQIESVEKTLNKLSELVR